ncbi:MAG TPA: hypothetical protein DHW61_11990 [Lachnoclostridium phytofermentans]|uniref:Uncharacterized protein n=1 Tax=Lachnoclostridium phytofermentans TaxID=66219 RepID=A0A3D2X8Q6_9FIRM|nr:hypothetical protein [Lachnoclostridium sp.]HCL03107.1 hypothetical protein [Lachnoclostridium phytofermentans]
MSSRNIELIGYDSNLKTVNKIAFFAEQDQEGNVFFKAESQNSSDIAALSIVYDQDEAFSEFCTLLMKVLTLQVNKLSIIKQ